MKISYAYRRMAFYPYKGATNWEMLPPKEVRTKWLSKVREIGFEGIEISTAQARGSGEADTRELRKELEDHGVPAVCVRGGGGFAHPRQAAGSRRNWEAAIKTAALIGAKVVNSAIGSPAPHRGGPGDRGVGERTNQVSSRLASHSDFEVTARHLREVGAMAADHGIELSIEMHQNSIADNSWSVLHLLQAIDRPNVGVNPDLGNLYWNYDEPEESCEDAIMNLAPKAKYWHCKQLQRVHVPELERAYYLKVPLPNGEIDYRFAISAMVDAGYDGYLAIEGCREGDQLYGDGRSVAYCRELLRELGQ
jgi:sugar phosphate isomerase/epimerase